MSAKKKLQVALTAPSLREIGGQSIQADRLIKAFENDAEIEVFLVPNNPQLKHLAFLQKFSGIRTLVNSLKYWGLLLAELRKADIVQISSAGETGYIIATIPPLIFAKIFNKKTILNYHHGGLAEHIENWKLTAKPTMKMFDKIVVPSEFLVDVFSKYDFQAKSISNFVETEKFTFRQRNPLKPVFLSNRNFEPYYNVSCVLRAFQIIQKEIPHASLTVAGYGSEEKKLKLLAAELKLQNTKFIGKVSPQEMPAVYNRADIFLNASLVDNMPLSFIEAFSCGLPIVSSNSGGIPYVVTDGETGLLAEPDNYRQLAEKALQLINNPKLAEMIIANAKLEAEKYGREKIQKDWRKFYESEMPH